MVQKKLKYLVLFSLMVIFIGCNVVVEEPTDGSTTGQGSPFEPTVTSPNIDDKGSVVLANGEGTNISFSQSGSPITSCTITPDLPTGLTLGSDCSIRGTATVNQESTSYVVTGRNDAGSSEATIAIKVVTANSDSTILSGTVTYDSVPFKSGLNSGLDYDNISRKKVRGAFVEILNGSGEVLASTSTDANGAYSVAVTGTSVKVRVSAQLLKEASAGNASWNFQVKDNTNGKSLYVMEGSLASLGNSGVQTRNLNAPSGWDGNSYASTRVAAPFAILDVVYQAVQKVKTAQSNVIFEPLNIFWSKNNITASGSTDLGQIGTSHFDGTSVFILGAADSDTDEYDSAVVGHEWGHYYESAFSRSDSIGGAHGTEDMLDIRLAFGEGFGTAMGCIIIDSPLYIDSLGSGQRQSFGDNLEAQTPSSSNPGWFNEASVYKILYDIYDSNSDVGDTLSFGFTPIHKVFLNAQKNTEAFTSIFTFITALKAENPGNDSAIDAITSNESIAPITDIYGTGRTNRRLENANPLYSDLSVGGSVDIVRNTSASATSAENKLGAYNFVKFTIPSSGSYTFNIRQVRGSGTPDPDLAIYKGSSISPIAVAEAGGVTDTLTTSLSAGVYRMAIAVYGQSSNATFRVTLD